VEALCAAYLAEWRVLPVVEGDRLRVLCATAPDPQVLDDLRWHFGRDISIEPLSEGEVDAALTRLEHGDARDAADLITALSEPESAAGDRDGDLSARVQEGPVIRLVNAMLREALEMHASDVHLETGQHGLDVRYRIDGVLVRAVPPPPEMAVAVIGRLKVMGELDVAERRRPQDGRVRLRVEGRGVDVRISTLPTLHGESLVLRLLETGDRRVGLEHLGMDPALRARFEEMLARPQGLLLATGPTGSGKTTTLYAALDHLRTGREKVVTVEDPVEYALTGVAQVPVNRKAGVTFASALRSILRQDPDVILVGEMRDPETAEICVQSALTGHLVLSTLHTNDAPSALVRLVDLNIAPYLVASTVDGVLAQRLVRTVCPECADEVPPPATVSAEMEAANLSAARVRRARGCGACRSTGYRGRTGIYELLEVNQGVRNALLRGEGTGAIRSAAAEAGMRRLREDGWRLVAMGLTTPEEIFRVAHA
jgi:general secretion pathway protein E